MIKILIASLIFFSSPAYSENRSKYFEGFEEGQTALSFFLGQPTFLRLDYWLGWRNALFFDGGYHFDKYFYGAANYSYYFFNQRDVLKKQSRDFWNSLLFYGGPGVFFGLASEDTVNDSFKMGARVFGGVEYLFDGQKYAIRAELGPAILFQGSSLIDIQGAIGFTYYFGDKDEKVKKKKSKNQ